MPRRGMGQATRTPRYPGLPVDFVWEGSDQGCGWIVPGSWAKREVTELLPHCRPLVRNCRMEELSGLPIRQRA